MSTGPSSSASAGHAQPRRLDIAVGVAGALTIGLLVGLSATRGQVIVGGALSLAFCLLVSARLSDRAPAVLGAALGLLLSVMGTGASGALGGYSGWVFRGTLFAVAISYFLYGRRKELVRSAMSHGVVLLGVVPFVIGTASALLVGALGVGATRAVFAVANAALLITLTATDVDTLSRWWARAQLSVVALSTVTALSTFVSPGFQLVERSNTFGILGIHPNIIGFLAWTAALRVAMDDSLGRVERGFTIVLATGTIALAQSRTSLLALGGGLLIHMYTQIQDAPGVIQRRQRRRAMATTVLYVGAAIYLAPVLLSARVQELGVLTGRTRVWQQVWANATALDLSSFIGQARTSTGLAEADLGFRSLRVVSIDNAILEVLSYSGFVGLGFFCVGTTLLARRVLQQRRYVTAATWPVPLLVGAAATLPFESWAAGGLLWVWIAIAEAQLRRYHSALPDVQLEEPPQIRTLHRAELRPL